MENVKRNVSLPNLTVLPLPLKLVISLALIVLGVGYLIAIYNLYLTYNLTDGKPGLTANDLKRTFYGNRENTKLAAKIDGGSMSQFLPVPGAKETIVSWIQDGAGESGYHATVRPILTQNCVRCHNPEGVSRFTPLTSYEQVMAVTQIDRGEPVGLWARVAHSHIQSLAVIFLVLGSVFCLTGLSDRTKAFVVVLPFAALLLDFSTRYLARYLPNVVYLMMAAGAFMGVALAVMILVPLFEMWVKRPEPGNTATEPR